MSDRRKNDRRQRVRRIANAEAVGERRFLSDRRKPERRTFGDLNVERRSDSRLKQQFPLIILQQKLERPGTRLTGEVQECSTRGLQFICPAHLELGESLELCLYPPDLFVPVQMRARIAWSKLSTRMNSYIYGVEIEPLDQEYAVAFHQFLSQMRITNNSSWQRISTTLRKFLYLQLLRPIINQSKLGSDSMGARADSGVNFDHIYSNSPRGNGTLGRLVDRVLLRLPASKATRNRKTKLEELINNEIARRMKMGMKTRILDLGSGPSRYLLESISPHMARSVEILCIDRDRESLNAGKVLAKGRPARFLRGDVFNLRHLCRLGQNKQWAPDLVIASGLIYYYEDRWVKALFKTVHEQLSSNGLFVVTNMIQNPNRRLIAELAKTQQGQAWIPIGRPAQLVRQWLAADKYKNIQQTIVPGQMYTIFTGRKLAVPSTHPAGQSTRVRISSTGALLKGRLFLPSTKPLHPPVIFIHGLGYCVDFYELDRNAFLARGFPFLEFNLRGHATSTGQFTLQSAVRDLETIREYLRQKNLGDKVFYLGHSVGALIAFLSAATTRDVLGISSINIVTSLSDSFRHWFQSGYIEKVRNDYTIAGQISPGISKFLEAPEAVDLFKTGTPPREDLLFPARYGLLKLTSVFDFFKEISESPDLLNTDCVCDSPLLFIRGVKDEIISPDRTDALYQRMRRAGTQLVRLPAKDHFHTGFWPQICQLSATSFEAIAQKP